MLPRNKTRSDIFFGTAMTRGWWGYSKGRAGAKPSTGEKIAVASACEKLIAQFFMPQFLPEIRPTKFNYPVAIYGKWHGNKYRFITRFRSNHRGSVGEEFEAPFARLEYVGPNRFDLSYHRHTGEWFCLYQAVSLKEGLQLIEEDGHFHPPC
jgi:hypothetical protein